LLTGIATTTLPARAATVGAPDLDLVPRGREEVMIERRVGRVSFAGALGTILALALTMLAVAPASAATFTETQNDSIPATDTDYLTPPAPPDPLVFDQFDATKGTLTQVKITFDSALTGSMAVENTSTSSTCDATLDWGADVTLDTTAGVLTSMLVQTENPPTLSIFDGTLDFGGTSGVTIGNLSQTDSQTQIITGAAMAPFIGGGQVALPVTATGTSRASGCGTVVFQFLTQAAVDVTVEYTFESNPAIDIEKATNGQDADAPTGPAIPVGDPVTWTYVVTNTGNVPLTQVTVVDDKGVVVTCPKDTLAVAESMTCTASGTATVGQYANVGTVTGFYPPNEETVDDKDPSHYIGETPQIAIKKFTNDLPGDDVNCVDGPSLSVGDPVVWTYVVTNPGDVPLSGVVVNDDKLGVTTGPDSGDANSNNLLDPGETWTYSAKGVAVAGQYNNVGDVKGTSPGQQTVVAKDPSCYTATEVLQASTTTTTTTTTTVAATSSTLPVTGPHPNLGPISAVGIGLVALGGLLVVTARSQSQVAQYKKEE
jgi:hypothetical protein